MRRPDTASATRTTERPKSRPGRAKQAPGHWRNRWKVPAKYRDSCLEQGASPLGDGTWLGYRKFPTSEAAEQYALTRAEENARFYNTHYLGAEFFPEY